MELFNVKDGGFLSRKLLLSILAMTLIFAGALVACGNIAFAANYSTLVGGLLGALGLFLGANVASIHSIGSANSKIVEAHSTGDLPEEK